MGQTNVLTSEPRPTFWKSASMLVGTFIVARITSAMAIELHSAYCFLLVSTVFTLMLAAWAFNQMPPVLRVGRYARYWTGFGFVMNLGLLISNFQTFISVGTL